ncbi:MAG TPA: ERF family protein, partial [Streptomyces sp.]
MTDTTSLAQALALLQTRLPKIEKSQTADVPTKNGGSYKYTYADLAQITRELMPILGDLGMAFIAKPTTTDDGRFVLAYRLLHVSGES